MKTLCNGGPCGLHSKEKKKGEESFQRDSANSYSNKGRAPAAEESRAKAHFKGLSLRSHRRWHVKGPRGALATKNALLEWPACPVSIKLCGDQRTALCPKKRALVSCHTLPCSFIPLCNKNLFSKLLCIWAQNLENYTGKVKKQNKTTKQTPKTIRER